MSRPMGNAMSDEADQTRRWLINASGAAILSGAIPGSSGQAAPAPGTRTDADPISPATTTLADYVAKTLDRELPAPRRRLSLGWM